MSNALFWNWMPKKLFGEKPKPPTAVAQPATVVTQPANIARDDVLKRLAKLRRATQLSELSQPNVKRTTLGAGAV